MQKPKDLQEYRTWLRSTCECPVSQRTETYYDSVVQAVSRSFEHSAVWQALCSSLNEIDQRYFLKTSYQLMPRVGPPPLQTKSFASFFLKTFRKNVLENDDWPNPPCGGWLQPLDCFERVDDLVRTRVVVAYLDGVSFLAEALVQICREHEADCRVDYEARQEGYYAVHFYIQHACDVPREDWDTKRIHMPIEIQITTQLQEVILRLLHEHYERRRAETPGQGEAKWQWSYESDEFATNYLGHILHYVEGMIMGVRNKGDGSGGQRAV